MTITRREFIGTMLTGTAAMALGGAAWGQAAARPKRPNVLILYTDDQRFDTIRALGCDEVLTPNMDRLARRGVSFERAATMGGHNGALCIASRAMLMSGRTIFHLQQGGSVIPTADVTLPELFQQAGYETFHTGKWHNDRNSFARSYSTGSKIFFGGMSDHLAVPVHDFDPTGQYPKEKATLGEKFSSELFSDAAIEFLKSRADDKPFMMVVAYTAPHDPRMAPEALRQQYDPARITVPPNFLPAHPFDNGQLKTRDELLAPFPRTPEIVREHLAAYYAMITHLDAQIGRVLDALKESGHEEDTIVVLAGDNGLAVGQHGLIGKQSVYEHSIRVPLVVAGPGVAQDRRSDRFCYLLDLYPTLCELCGVKPPATAEGVSLTPILRGEPARAREALFLCFAGLQRAVRTDAWKLIEYRVGGQRHTQLFDMQADPWETKNRADDPAHAATLEQMRIRLRECQEQFDDPWLKESDGKKQGAPKRKASKPAVARPEAI